MKAGEQAQACRLEELDGVLALGLALALRKALGAQPCADDQASAVAACWDSINPQGESACRTGF